MELVIPLEIPSKETKAEIEIHPVTAEAKIGWCSIKFNTLYSSIHFALTF